MNNRHQQVRSRCVLAGCVIAALFSATTYAKEFPQNLGFGLDSLVASSAALRAGNAPVQLHDGYATEAAAY